MTKVEQSMDRARKLVASRQFGEAVKHLKVVTLLAPGHLEAHRLASAVYWRDLQQPELAVEHFGAVARLAPEDPVALANYSALLVFLRRHGEAIEPLRAGMRK